MLAPKRSFVVAINEPDDHVAHHLGATFLRHRRAEYIIGGSRSGCLSSSSSEPPSSLLIQDSLATKGYCHRNLSSRYVHRNRTHIFSRRSRPDSFTNGSAG